MSEAVEGRMLLVEFVGAAGVGKTFLASKLLSVLSEDGLPVEDFARLKIERSVGNLLPVIRASAIAIWLRPRPLRHYRKSAKKLAEHGIRHATCRNSNGIFICDDGIFHKVRALARRNTLRSMTQIADRVILHFGIPDVVVVVEASEEEICVRRSRRNRPGEVFSRDSVRNDILMLEDSVRTIKYMQQHAPNGLQIVRIDSVEGEIDGSIRRLADHLRKVFEDPSVVREIHDFRL